MQRDAKTDFPIHELLARRRSPYSFDGQGVGSETLRSLFEAACRAASPCNQQPWRFLVAPLDRSTEFDRMLGCLVEPNQAWAKNAGALALAAVSTRFTRNDKPDRAREPCNVPEGHGLLAGIAICYVTSEPLVGFAARGSKERQRKPQAEFVSSGSWGNAY